MSSRDPRGAFEEQQSRKKRSPDPHMQAQTHAPKHAHKHIL